MMDDGVLMMDDGVWMMDEHAKNGNNSEINKN